MAQLKERAGGWETLFQPTPVDRIIGADEAKRSTKTYISSEPSSILLGLIATHAENLARVVRELDHDESCPMKGACANGSGCEFVLQLHELVEKYPGVRGWFALHKHLVEHSASIDGFSLRVVARVNQLQQEAQKTAESSLRTEAPDAQ